MARSDIFDRADRLSGRPARPTGVSNGRRALEYGTVLAIVLTILAVGAATQDRIAVNSGRGFDGSHYYDLAEQFRAGERPSGESRFTRRVGTPILASLVPGDDLVLAFYLVNAGATVLSALLLYAWLRRYVAGAWLSIGLVLVHATHWLQLVRFTAFYPVLVDAWAQACCFAGLLCIASYEDRPRTWKLAAITLIGLIGVWFREVVLLIPLTFLVVRPLDAWRGMKARPTVARQADAEHAEVAEQAGVAEQASVGRPFTGRLSGRRFGERRISLADWLAWIPGWRHWVPLIAAVAALGLLEAFVVATDPAFNESDHLVGRALSRSLLAYTLGWMVAFGPALAVILSDWRGAFDFFRRHTWMLAYIMLVAGVGWAGSFESERHALNWGTPIVLALAGRSLERRAVLTRVPVLVTLVLAQLLVNRVFWTVPQPANNAVSDLPAMLLTPIGPHVGYLDLFPANMSRDLAWMQFLQHLALGTVVLWLLRTKSVSQDVRGAATWTMNAAQRARAAAASLPARVRAIRRLGLPAAVSAAWRPFLIGSSVGALLVFLAQPGEPIPIHIRWTVETQPSLQATLERQWQLTDGWRREGTTWAYILRDASTGRIRTIVQHPNVDDTAHVNRRWFRPELKYDRARQAALFGPVLGSLCAAAMVLRAASRGARR